MWTKVRGKNAGMNDEIWILVLAAGFSKRMGEQKLLLPLHGESLIRFLVKRLLAANADGVAIVTNSAQPSLKDEINDLPVVILENSDASQGLSSSLKTGIEFFIQQRISAAIIALGDQPFINLQVIDLLIDQGRRRKSQIIQPVYRTTPSHPVFFSSEWFDDILGLKGDQGAKGILTENHEKVTRIHVNLAAPFDIDCKIDYEQSLAQRENLGNR